MISATGPLCDPTIICGQGSIDTRANWFCYRFPMYTMGCEPLVSKLSKFETVTEINVTQWCRLSTFRDVRASRASFYAAMKVLLMSSSEYIILQAYQKQQRRCFRKFYSRASKSWHMLFNETKTFKLLSFVYFSAEAKRCSRARQWCKSNVRRCLVPYCLWHYEKSNHLRSVLKKKFWQKPN